MEIKSKELARRTLGIDVEDPCFADLDTWSIDAQVALYKKQHRRLALQWHPDKNPTNTESANQQFMIVQAAYDFLLTPIENERADKEFNQYFPLVPTPAYFKDFNLPAEGMVDLRLEILIFEAFDDLKLRFFALETQAQKTEFAEQYRDFIALARLIESSKPALSEQRHNQFVALYQGYTNKLAYFFRTNMLELFGEELLDDFRYREAIALGQWRSVLAYRKLFNPVKLLAAVVLTLLAPLKAGFFHFQVVLGEQLKYIAAFLRAKQNTPEGVRAAYKTLAILALSAILPTLVFYVIPDFYLILMCIPLINTIAFSLACPVNRLVRPFLKWAGLETSLGPYMVFLLPPLVAGVVAGLVLLFSAVSISLTAVLEATIFLCSAYILYALARLMYAMFQVSRTAGLLSTAMLLISLIMNIFTPIGATMASVSLMKHCFLVASHALLYYSMLKVMDQGGAFVNSILEKLSMPTKPIHETFKEKVNEVIHSSDYSEAYFQTQADLAPLKPEQRTFWRTAQSFFGFASVPNPSNEAAEQADVPHSRVRGTGYQLLQAH